MRCRRSRIQEGAWYESPNPLSVSAVPSNIITTSVVKMNLFLIFVVGAWGRLLVVPILKKAEYRHVTPGELAL